MQVEDIWVQINDVNKKVNKEVTFTADIDLFGKSDFWDIVENAGDCDDYAVTKRSMLRDMFPDNHDAFRLATCWIESRKGPGTGGYHAVLIVVTDDGDYLLDNRYATILPFNKAPYKWHLRENPNSPKWDIIGNN